jgi:hypothetical protein
MEAMVRRIEKDIRASQGDSLLDWISDSRVRKSSSSGGVSVHPVMNRGEIIEGSKRQADLPGRFERSQNENSLYISISYDSAIPSRTSRNGVSEWCYAIS